MGDALALAAQPALEHVPPDGGAVAVRPAVDEPCEEANTVVATVIDARLSGRSQPLTSEADVLPYVNRVLSKPPKLRELRCAGALQSDRYVLTGP